MDLMATRKTWWLKPVLRYIIALFLVAFTWLGHGIFIGLATAALFVIVDFGGHKLGRFKGSARVIFYSRLSALFMALNVPVLIEFVLDVNEALNCESSPNCKMIKTK